MDQRPRMSTIQSSAPPTQTDLAWAAGFFDGEGWVMVTRKRSGDRMRFGLQVAVGQTSLEPLEKFQVWFGGRIHRLVDRPRSHPVWQWRVGSWMARAVLQQLLPFLVVKRAEAETAIRFQDWMDRPRQRDASGHRVTLSTEDIRLSEQFRIEIREIRSARTLRSSKREGVIRALASSSQPVEEVPASV